MIADWCLIINLNKEYAIMKKLFYLMMLALPMIFVACDDDDNLPRVDITVDFDNVRSTSSSPSRSRLFEMSNSRLLFCAETTIPKTVCAEKRAVYAFSVSGA